MVKTASYITWAEIIPHLHSIRQQGAIIARLTKAQITFPFFIESMYSASLNIYIKARESTKDGAEQW